MKSRLPQVAKVLWASPNSLIGIGVGTVGLLTGGRVCRVGRILEFHGGFVTWGLSGTSWVLRKLGVIDTWISAMTLGHTVLGRCEDDLHRCREHELVHVRQYERWGPAFLPAYFACSAYLWWKGKDSYRDNPFEREAYDHDDASG